MPIFDLGGAALHDYRSAVVRPGDFDDFWNSTLSEARSHPLAPKFEPHDAGLKLIDVFDVTFAGFDGQPVRGWMLLPKGGTKLPLVVRYVGYGGGRGLPHEHLAWPAAGYAHLVMDTRGQGSAWSTGDTPDPVGSDPAHPGFMTRGILRKESYYYRRVFTDAVRALEAGRGHPAVDADRVAVVGASQGGGISIAVAALDPSVRALMADVPFLCDFPRAVRIAPRDPYGEISRFLAVHRDKVDTVFETLRYFDGTCFAPDISAQSLISVAIMDTICPPSTVYGAFNALAASDKSMAVYEFNDHEGGGGAQLRRQLEWLSGRL